MKKIFSGLPTKVKIFPLLVILGLLLSNACTPDETDGNTNDDTSSNGVDLNMLQPTPYSNVSIWIPPQNTSWQWVLGVEELDISLSVGMYDLDLFETTAETINALHIQGTKVVCYISAGSWEDWRPDRDEFPDEVIGKKYAGWQGERWLDIRAIDILGPAMLARLDLCKEKGFDGIEPDNIDGYTNDTGFDLTYTDQLHYNIWLANEAHQRGLSIGLKNNPEQATDLLEYFDWALTEDCFDQGWCEDLSPFLDTGKAVFAAEYTDTGIALEDFCPQAKRMNISTLLKNRDLDNFRQSCQD